MRFLTLNSRPDEQKHSVLAVSRRPETILIQTAMHPETSNAPGAPWVALQMDLSC